MKTSVVISSTLALDGSGIHENSFPQKSSLISVDDRRHLLAFLRQWKETPRIKIGFVFPTSSPSGLLVLRIAAIKRILGDDATPSSDPSLAENSFRVQMLQVIEVDGLGTSQSKEDPP